MLQTRIVLSIEDARMVARLAVEKALARGLKIAVAVADEGGRMLYFERMDGVPWGSGEVAIGKAVSAAAYRRDTLVFDERLAQGRHAVLGQPFAFPIQGGVALTIRGDCVGGIGASGANAFEDA